jgi:Prealbumin-like fold domain
MAAFQFRRRRTRRLWVFGGTTAVLVATVLFLVASAGGTLSGGSTFESGDGDLAANTSTPPAPHDWNNPVEPISCPNSIPGGGANCGLDLVKSQADDSLGQGAKEDDPAPSVVSGQIPPSKDDLSRFYVNKERAGGNDYLYLAWERSNLLGSAHMDFEFSQSSALSGNGVTTQRTAGDLLIDFDFGGSGVPVLQKHTWITSGNAATDCEASNTLPCWDKAVNLGSFAEAQVNSAPVTDTNPPSAPRTLDGNTKNGINSTFGEAGINLTGSGIFNQNTCTHFGAATLKSRSSGNSFTSELKDFIAPIPVNITNCGTVNIHKQDDAGTPLQGAVFTLFTDAAPVDGNPPHGAEDTATSLTCTTNASGNCTIIDVPFGSYWAVETTGVSGHDPAADQSFSLTSNTPNLTISLTFVDPRQHGAILVTKTVKVPGTTGTQPLANVNFTVDNVTHATDAQGHACFDGLTLNQAYNVHETPPTGYSGSSDQSITPTTAGDCSAGATKAPANFTDKPLTNLSISVSAQVAGASLSKVTCDNGAGNSGSTFTDPATVNTTGLEPGTYTCTIVIDP